MNDTNIEYIQAGQERYYLATDNDGHWFVVPVSHALDWDDWLTLDPDNPAAWDAPTFARNVDGPHNVLFTNYEVR